MSYGQPCRRSTAGPSAGPASTYPTLRRPASICFSRPNDVFVPGLIWGSLPLLDCALPEPIATIAATASVMVTLRKTSRRTSLDSELLTVLMGETPLFDWLLASR